MTRRRETHEARHRRLHEAVDELGADYLRHHPDADLSSVSFQRVLDWSGAQARHATEPDPSNGVHHNGAQFKSDT